MKRTNFFFFLLVLSTTIVFGQASVNLFLKEKLISSSSNKTSPTDILIKGDSKSNYPAVKNVFKTLSDRDVLKFGLITGDEAMPVAPLK